ncbi:hypothetical protein KGM_203175 [Danaus plexippus plexippus]|uniref:Uncharacterized protein n=1 Tax=Danaus plexippus plexippus TaxID=278856 RepID=A0A212F184_DANPL|nr:hypothetical protein KGM_203175 [Danaus plexippus plexippus]
MSIVCIFLLTFIVFQSFVKPEYQNKESSNVALSSRYVKDYMTSVVKEQSSKIQMLLKKIQSNALSVLKRIRNINLQTKIGAKRNLDEAEYQVKSPIAEVRKVIVQEKANSRNYNSHYLSTGFGTSGSSNYGMSTYHHHSIGFDPINIVVSMSLLSFLLQALQGFLRTRLPTPVIEARSSRQSSVWRNDMESNSKDFRKNDYIKKKMLKDY